MNDARNNVGKFMLQHGIHMGDKLDAGRVRDLLEEFYKVLDDANSLCRSAHSIAERKGLQTNWDAFLVQLKRSLELQHKVMYPAAALTDHGTPLPAVDPSEPPRPPQPPDSNYCLDCGGGVTFETVGPGKEGCTCPPRKIPVQNPA